MENTDADVSYITNLFSVIRKLPDGHRYDEDFFKQRLAAAVNVEKCRRNLDSALMACYDEPEELDKLPKPVNHAIDQMLCDTAIAIEDGFETSTIPLLPRYGPSEHDDSNEADAVILARCHAKYAHKPLAHYRDHPVTAGRFLFVFFYLAASDPAIIQKWRLHDAQRVELIHYEPPLNSGTWADFELFDVDNGEYTTPAVELEMKGRGCVLIFRKTGLEKPDCPAVDRREHWAVFSAKSKPTGNFPPSQPSSPLPPSSPPAESEADVGIAEEVTAPITPVRASLPGASAARTIELLEPAGPSRKRRTELEDDTIVPKKQKLAHIYASEESGSDVGDSSEVEILECKGPLFDNVA